MYNECLSHMRYFFFSQGSNGTGKNEFVSQYTFYSLIFPSNIKYKNKITDNYHAPHTDISNRKRQ